jgi:hypothetical protein
MEFQFPPYLPPPNSDDLKMILDHFPDGVDVMLIPAKETTEFEFNPDKYISPNVVDARGEDFDHVTELQLKELEPETGIYAAMSPVTNRIYVYVDLLEHLG